MTAPTRLQQEIAERILHLVREDALAPGAWLNENATARRLGVSHTALQKAQRAGRIAPEPDGAWDVEKVRALLADSSDPVRKTATLPVAPPAAPRI